MFVDLLNKNNKKFSYHIFIHHLHQLVLTSLNIVNMCLRNYDDFRFIQAKPFLRENISDLSKQEMCELHKNDHHNKPV